MSSRRYNRVMRHRLLIVDMVADCTGRRMRARICRRRTHRFVFVFDMLRRSRLTMVRVVWLVRWLLLLVMVLWLRRLIR